MKHLLKPVIFGLAILGVIGLSYFGVTQFQQLKSDRDILEVQKMDFLQTINALKKETESLREGLVENSGTISEKTKPVNEYGTDIKVGDEVLGMTVVSKDDGETKFKGMATISGTYENIAADTQRRADEVNNVCFFPDTASQLKLPNAKAPYSRNSELCFTNQKFAKAAFSPVEKRGLATITINDYIDVYGGPDSIDTAVLINVIEKK